MVGAVLWILLGPAFHRLFLVMTVPNAAPSFASPPSAPSSPTILRPDHLAFRDTVAGGTLRLSLTGLTGGMAALDDIDEAYVQYTRDDVSILGGAFSVPIPQPSQVVGLRFRYESLTAWGGEERTRKEDVWISLQPGVYGPYLIPGMTNAQDVEVWWRGRPLSADQYEVYPDGTLRLRGFPEILEGDRLLVRFSTQNRRTRLGGDVNFPWGSGQVSYALPQPLTRADYDTLNGIAIFVGKGRGRVAPVFLHVGAGKGEYLYDPSFEAFRYVGPGKGTHVVRFPDPRPETFVGLSVSENRLEGEAQILGHETWKHRVGWHWRSESIHLWGGIQDTGITTGVGTPYQYRRWVGMSFNPTWGSIQGEGDPWGSRGRVGIRWHQTRSEGYVGVVKDGIEMEGDMDAWLDVEGGMGPAVQAQWSRYDTTLFGGLRLRRRGVTFLAGIRYRDSLQQEARIQWDISRVRGMLLIQGEAPLQGEIQWDQGRWQGIHRRERGFFPDGWSYDTTARMIQTHEVYWKGNRIRVLWDEGERYEIHGGGQTSLGWFGVGWRHNAQREAYGQGSMAWGLLRLQVEARSFQGSFEGQVLDVEGGWRVGMWEILGGYEWRHTYWVLRRRSGGIGWNFIRPTGSIHTALWYHHTQAPSWVGGLPRGLELRVNLTWQAQIEGGKLVLQAGGVIQQDGWIAPMATFSFEGGMP